MKQVKLSEFIAYLEAQIGQPYLWGGQHTELTPDNYKTVIKRRESDPANRVKVEKFCEALFAQGQTVLYAYDCSGLGMYYLQNVTGVYAHDLSANGMMGQCAVKFEPKKGYWVFRTDSTGCATHIGYMVSDTELIEAKGRAYGVVRTVYRKKDWNVIGKPKCIDFEEVHPVGGTVEVIGRSVNVRNAPNSTGKHVMTAHRGDTFPLLGIASSGWYQIDTGRDFDTFISNRKDLTRIV